MLAFKGLIYDMIWGVKKGGGVVNIPGGVSPAIDIAAVHFNSPWRFEGGSVAAPPGAPR